MRAFALSRVSQIHALLFCSSIVKAVQYGENHAAVQKDEELVAANFQDTSETLLSPAFANPQSVLPGFANGTDGPTDDATLGAYINEE